MIYKNISIIVAITDNFAIGKNNDMLFHLSEDLKRFKAITSGHSIIMGRNTLLSLPKWPLPNRRNIVITSHDPDEFPGCIVVRSIQAAFDLVKDEEEAFVIGGGMIYRETFDLCHKLYLTLAHVEKEADVFFPEVDYKQWNVISEEKHFSEKNNFSYSYLDLERKN